MEARILEKRSETPDAVTLRLAWTPALCAATRPGQFVMLGAPVGEEARLIRRSYSVAAIGPDWVEVTIKAQVQGIFSPYACGLAVGDSLDLTGPFGRHFLWDPAAHDVSVPVVFVAGGTGLAPFRTMVRAARQAQFRERGGTGYVFYSARTGADVLYANELFAKQSEQGTDSWTEAGFRVVVCITRPTDDDLATWSGPLGRISPKLLRDTLGESVLSNALYFVCGPTPLVVDVQTILGNLGVPAEQVKTEKYGAIEG